jgi:hypothetical protein
MIVIGTATTFFAANTYEVTSKNDIPGIANIKSYSLTQDSKLNDELVKDTAWSFDEGSFGVPAKIRFPENNKHIAIEKALHTQDGWKARMGVGHYVVTADQRQKAFGEVVVYMRTNVSTINNVGEFFYGDVVNIVTDKGWQLGYSVRDVADSISELHRNSSISTIVVQLTDDKTGQTIAFTAELSVVGERV